MDDKQQYLNTLGEQAKAASYAMASLTASQKRDLLRAIAAKLTDKREIGRAHV